MTTLTCRHALVTGGSRAQRELLAGRSPGDLDYLYFCIEHPCTARGPATAGTPIPARRREQGVFTEGQAWSEACEGSEPQDRLSGNRRGATPARKRSRDRPIVRRRLTRGP